MSLLSRLRSRLSSESPDVGDEMPLAQAERLLRQGGAVDRIRRVAGHARANGRVEQAWVALFAGDPAAALDFSYATATARPYDVDSRIVHGTVRLARNELAHAEHEFDAVIEEFGAESDAADGRRATILARGFAPLDELPASDEEWESAAMLLTTLWRILGVVDERLNGLEDAHPDGLSVIMQALRAGLAEDSESEHGTV
jgi:hypothetical protein